MFNTEWNADYDFNSELSRKEIVFVESYDLTADVADYKSGQIVDSPWGSNQVIEARHENGVDTCIKKITVKPGFMLSLQRHRGRAELWEVIDGALGVICDGAYIEVLKGQSISLQKGCVHCMINPFDMPVTVMETQTGICRENDNIRLMDSNNRPTYPLTSEVEYKSALLYQDMMQKLKRQ